MKEESFELGKHVPVLPKDFWVTAITLMKVVQITLMSILETTVWVINIIEMRVTFSILNLLGPFLFLFDILEI